MKEQALKVAQDFDELAEIGFENVLRSEGDSAVSRQLMQYQVQFAKEHQANAKLLRDLVAQIEVSEAYIKQLESGLDSTIAFSKAQVERQPKDLSIEEIESVFYQKCWYYDEDEKFDYYGFAKAILKKARENDSDKNT